MTSAFRSAMVNPQFTMSIAVELFPDDDPENPVGEIERSAHIMPDGRVFLARDFIGSIWLRQALANPKCTGLVPISVTGGIICVELGWLEQLLPEYAGMWARIRMMVDFATKGSS